MKTIDNYSYHLGAADCFCEMVAAGVKKIALSHPCNSKQERDGFLSDFDKLCIKYGVNYYVEDEPFLTALFPEEMNKGKYNVIFYCDKEYLNRYLELKETKKNLISSNEYDDANRTFIAREYGKLLSYSDAGIERLLQKAKKES